MGKRKIEGTLDRQMKDPAFRAAFEKEYAALEVSEILGSANGRAGNICSSPGSARLSIRDRRAGDQIGKTKEHRI